MQEHADDVSPMCRSYRRIVSIPFSGIMGAAVITALVRAIQEFDIVDEDFGILKRLHLFMTAPGPADGDGEGDGDRVKGAE